MIINHILFSWYTRFIRKNARHSTKHFTQTVHCLAIWNVYCLRKCVDICRSYSKLKLVWSLIEPELEKLINLVYTHLFSRTWITVLVNLETSEPIVYSLEWQPHVFSHICWLYKGIYMYFYVFFRYFICHFLLPWNTIKIELQIQEWIYKQCT